MSDGDEFMAVHVSPEEWAELLKADVVVVERTSLGGGWQHVVLEYGTAWVIIFWRAVWRHSGESLSEVIGKTRA